MLRRARTIRRMWRSDEETRARLKSAMHVVVAEAAPGTTPLGNLDTQQVSGFALEVEWVIEEQPGWEAVVWPRALHAGIHGKRGFMGS